MLLLYHLFAPVGAPKNVRAHAISVDINENTVIALKIAPGESASGAAESAQPQSAGATSHGAVGSDPPSAKAEAGTVGAQAPTPQRPQEVPWGSGESACAVVPSAIAGAGFEATGLKQKAHQLTEMIHATYEALDAIAAGQSRWHSMQVARMLAARGSRRSVLVLED